jgi:hypothetical protein
MEESELFTRPPCVWKRSWCGFDTFPLDPLEESWRSPLDPLEESWRSPLEELERGPFDESLCSPLDELELSWPW